VHERGARAILVRSAPVPGWGGSRSFALPECDPFWQRASELGVLVAMHSSDSGYARQTQEWEGSRGEHLPFVANVFRMTQEWRPVTDAVASWVCHGALFRHLELKVAVIENGSSWLVPLLDTLGDVYKKAPEGFAGTTQEMLDFVNGNPDAIGFADIDAVTEYPNLSVVPINGYPPDQANVLSGNYKFDAPEYLYTTQDPSAQVSEFLSFLRSPAETAQLVAQDAGFIPCVDLSGAVAGDCL
jgi:hypothetical protein